MKLFCVTLMVTLLQSHSSELVELGARARGRAGVRKKFHLSCYVKKTKPRFHEDCTS